ncbi:hypothetical protein [Enterococcus sp. BWR-S5]|uniref:hypothetical protein n=1 Tax=Enterococcus sp. BWR-S5 TaxID=2787714 RepID=UPI0019249114|nr:hypothetical protein [Enterococcus sp. BWR-S5]MBL1226492.1 hypothetical protein [Enterococcus sp. BWR-S5]
MGIVLLVISFIIGFLVAVYIGDEAMTGKDFVSSLYRKNSLSASEIWEMETIIRSEGLWDKKAKFRIAKQIKHVLIIDKDSYIEKKIGL